MNELQNKQIQDASPSIFNAQNQKLKTAEEVLDALRKEAAENEADWLEENLEVSLEAVKEKRGVR